MTNRKTTRPEATDQLPLETPEIDSILRSAVLGVVRRPRELVDDLVQDAWVALLGQRERLATVDPSALPTYVRRIGTSSVIDRLRHLRAQKRGGATTTIPVDTLRYLECRRADPERSAIQRETLRQTVRRAAGRGRRSLAVLELLFLEGLDPAVAAVRLGISRETVYGAVHRARARLARHAG